MYSVEISRFKGRLLPDIGGVDCNSIFFRLSKERGPEIISLHNASDLPLIYNGSAEGKWLRGSLTVSKYKWD